MNLDQYTISFIFSGNDLETTNIYIYMLQELAVSTDAYCCTLTYHLSLGVFSRPVVVVLDC